MGLWVESLVFKVEELKPNGKQSRVRLQTYYTLNASIDEFEAMTI